MRTEIKKSLDFDIAYDNYISDENKTIKPEVSTAKVEWKGWYAGWSNDYPEKSSTYTLTQYSDDTYERADENAEYRITDALSRPYYITKDQIASWIDAFDTGGYTGSWGPEGKMAMLH
jgi:hypothetical protein